MVSAASGSQQNWPTAPGAFIGTNYAVPGYLGYPTRPYNVINYLDATTCRNGEAHQCAANIIRGLSNDNVFAVAFARITETESNEDKVDEI